MTDMYLITELVNYGFVTYCASAISASLGPCFKSDRYGRLLNIGERGSAGLKPKIILILKYHWRR